MGMFVTWMALVGPAWADDVRDLANAWKVAHNEAVELQEAGDTAAALPLAKQAAALAPDHQKTRPLILLAEVAGEEKDYITALNALDALLPRTRVPWGVFYNGSITARSGGYPASSYRYAQAALDRAGDQQGFVAPVTVYAALELGLLDRAVAAAAYLPKEGEEHTRAMLVRELSYAGRCGDARRAAEGLPPDDEREELLSSCE